MTKISGSFPDRDYIQSLRNHNDCLEETINNLILLLKSVPEEKKQYQLFDEISKLDGIAAGIEQMLDDMEGEF